MTSDGVGIAIPVMSMFVFITTMVLWGSHGEYAPSNHVMVLHINRCASYLPLSLHGMYQTSEQDISLTSRAISALNSSRGGDCHMHEAPRSEERTRARPQICKYHTESFSLTACPRLRSGLGEARK